MARKSVRLPVELEVRNQDYGKLRSINVVDDGVDEAFIDTQDWKLECLSIESHVRELIDVTDFQESKKLGSVKVDPSSIEWEFVLSEDIG